MNTYFFKIDKRTCKATLVNTMDEADYVIDDINERHAKMIIESTTIMEKHDKIGVFDTY